MIEITSVVATEPREGRTAEAPPEPAADRAAAEPLLESELLVEDVSIDGMCGVY